MGIVRIAWFYFFLILILLFIEIHNISNIALFLVALVVQIHSSMQNASMKKNTHGEMQ
jgi:hypothetical protein